MRFEISNSLFFKIGMGCFSLVGITGIINMAINWEFWNLWSKIGSGASAFFNLVLAAFFYQMLRNDPSVVHEGVEELKAEDIDTIIKEIGGKKKRGKRS